MMPSAEKRQVSTGDRPSPRPLLRREVLAAVSVAPLAGCLWWGDDPETGLPDGSDEQDFSAPDDRDEEPPEELTISTPSSWPTLGLNYHRNPAYHSSGGGTGEMLYHVSLDEVITAMPAVTDGLLYLPTESIDEVSYVRAYEVETGTLDWSFETDATVASPVVASNDNVYAGAEAQNLYALKSGDGTLDWHVEGGSDEHLMSLDGDDLFIASQWSIHSMDPATGDIRWSEDLGRDIRGNPTVHDEMVLIATGETVYAFDRTTGDLEWDYQFDSFWAIGPALSIAAETVIVTIPQEGIYGLDINTGVLRWEQPLEAGLFQPVVIHAGRAFVPHDRELLSIDLDSGAIEWDVSTPVDGEGNPASIWSAAAAGDTIYIGTGAGSYAAFDIDSGDLVWERSELFRVSFLLALDDVLLAGGPAAPWTDTQAELFAFDAGWL